MSTRNVGLDGSGVGLEVDPSPGARPWRGPAAQTSSRSAVPAHKERVDEQHLIERRNGRQ